MSRDTKKIASPWKFSENDLWDLSKEQEASFDAALRKSIEETSKWIRGMKAERIQSARHVKQMRFGHSRDQ